MVSTPVHKNHRATEGMNRTHLTFQRNIAGIGLDIKGLGIRSKGFVRVDRLGDGVGDSVSAQDLAEGHAHFGAQHTGDCGFHRDAVEGGDFAHQAVIDDLCVQ